MRVFREQNTRGTSSFWQRRIDAGRSATRISHYPMALNEEQREWFEKKLKVHEPMIRNWLQSRYGAALDVDDVIQESFLRVFEALERAEVSSPKAFFFAVARNAAVDQMRKSKLATTEMRGEWDELEFLDESEGIEETVARNQELELLTEAIQSLPERCRRIFTLCKVYGMSYKQIGKEMGISPHTVSAQITIGVSKVTAYLNERDAFGRNAS